VESIGIVPACGPLVNGKRRDRNASKFAEPLFSASVHRSPPQRCSCNLFSTEPSANFSAFAQIPARHLRASAKNRPKEVLMKDSHARRPDDFALQTSTPSASRPRGPIKSVLETMPLVLETESKSPSPPAEAAEFPQAPQNPGRCAERGCVFPAEENVRGLCLYHERQRLEPAFFSSWQPTWLLIHRSAGVPGPAQPPFSRPSYRRRGAAHYLPFIQV
jgi:hypothetical protein